MTEKQKMICEECGVEMNQHAEKIDYSSPEESGAFDADFGGVVEEVHSCPRCGRTETRRAD
jgi:ribosomal protein S27AE